MSGQLPLDLRPRPALDRAAFMVSACNSDAVAMVDDPALWPGGKLALVGPEGTGKTHLAVAWADRTGAVITSARTIDLGRPPPAFQVIEDVDRIAGDLQAEEAVFHLHNGVVNQGGKLLLTGRSAPQNWPLLLPDLASRMRATALARLDTPDEALLGAVMVKLLADRGVKAAPSLVHYVLPRIERSMQAVEQMVERLCDAGFSADRKIGRKLAIDLLDEG
ncbi:MAG: DnaA/Hda family protein [Pseudomonadota bacterium]